MTERQAELIRRLERAPLSGGVRLTVDDAAQLLALIREIEAKHVMGPPNTKRVPRAQHTKAVGRQ